MTSIRNPRSVGGFGLFFGVLVKSVWRLVHWRDELAGRREDGQEGVTCIAVWLVGRWVAMGLDRMCLRLGEGCTSVVVEIGARRGSRSSKCRSLLI